MPKYHFFYNFRSNEPIHFIFERNRDFIIIHHPAKFHKNRSVKWSEKWLLKFKGRFHPFRSKNSLPRPKTLFLERYYFHRRVSVCVSVCLCVYHSINSKSSQPIFMKFGRTVYNDKISVPFEDEIDRVDRTQTLPKRVVKIDIKATYLWISQ